MPTLLPAPPADGRCDGGGEGILHRFQEVSAGRSPAEFSSGDAGHVQERLFQVRAVCVCCSVYPRHDGRRARRRNAEAIEFGAPYLSFIASWSTVRGEHV